MNSKLINKLFFIWFDNRSQSIYIERFLSYKLKKSILLTTNANNSSHIYYKHGIKIINLPIVFKLTAVTFYLSGLWKQLKTNDFDYIYLHDEAWNFTSLAVALFSKFNNKKFCIDVAVTEGKSKSLSFYFKIFIEKFVLNQASVIFFRNQFVKKALISRVGNNIIGKKSFELSNGFSKNDFYKLPGVNKRNILYIGRIIEHKGVMDLLFLAKKYNEKITFFGMFESIKFKKRFFEYIKSNNLENYISIENFTDNKTLINNFYNNHFVTILPSHTSPKWIEQFGRVLVESISAGTVAIGSNVGFIPNIVSKKCTFDEKNIDDMYRLLKYLQNPKNYSDTLTKQKIIIENFTYDKISKKVLRILNENF